MSPVAEHYSLQSSDEITYDNAMDINDLYSKSIDGDVSAEKRLFQYLSVSFRMFALQRVMNRQDAEDVVQSSLMVVFNGYKDIDIQTSFASWAHKVLKNQLLAYFKAKRLPKNSNQSLVIDYSRESDEKDTLLTMRLGECIKRISSVNRNFARILNLHYQGYSTQEICETLQLSRSHFYTTLSRARKMLRICLEEGKLE